MLQLILGRAGSGKTGWLRDTIAAKARSGEESLILLVPEQVSFENERALLGLLGPALARRVEVLSFTRLTDRIQREAGGGAGRRLQDSGRCMLMTAAQHGKPGLYQGGAASVRRVQAKRHFAHRP